MQKVRTWAPRGSRAINEERRGRRAARGPAPLSSGRAARAVAAGHKLPVEIFLPRGSKRHHFDPFFRWAEAARVLRQRKTSRWPNS